MLAEMPGFHLAGPGTLAVNEHVLPLRGEPLARGEPALALDETRQLARDGGRQPNEADRARSFGQRKLEIESQVVQKVLGSALAPAVNPIRRKSVGRKGAGRRALRAARYSLREGEIDASTEGSRIAPAGHHLRSSPRDRLRPGHRPITSRDRASGARAVESACRVRRADATSHATRPKTEAAAPSKACRRTECPGTSPSTLSHQQVRHEELSTSPGAEW